jgi:prepilin signal peptidase PulO-like enzyme (type II secretory pathway)
MILYDILLQVWWFVLGAVLGSFLNVVIYRLPRRESLIWPGSHCPKCGHLIRWYDNIPILSWLLLQGRCRDCSAPISARYPVIEALAALTVGLIAFAVSGGRWGAVLAGGRQAWYVPFFSFAILQVLVYSTFFLSLMAAVAMTWDRQLPPRLLWLPAWCLVFVGVLVQGKEGSGAEAPLLALPAMSWLHWGMALIVGSLCELLMSEWKTDNSEKPSSSKRRRRKDRQSKRNQVAADGTQRETQSTAPGQQLQPIDFVSLAGIAAILFRPEIALILVFGLLFLGLFLRVGSLLSRNPKEGSRDFLRVRAILLTVGLIASWGAVLLEAIR